ncbi:copper amine oxidase N-terminal domain-containing protein (plasmid) [Paenibacillus urinalis]|uniref:Copper amine oxidase N-terminal domain-containing protein n=1 Tax=Paenibacillus urinalis TaxID=521520 RepID=A0AAX3N8J5_9BACL|nr:MULTISPECIES: copper amine oxidase N-terminal domain-containing protein [Paenibacillus]MCM3130498.1 copper amine oxidase N-terminal domain-containing protein [Paenibacillus sp. MER 78]WDH85384.1 copper amine oxidase N-terminal domain-containing protein [Paenibacillus urinalis]WDH95177.1 copper amine oxidase N-terminal domain-containing protein [Paenibacillus urinalis]WDI05350.1 copper amine oxidase N-terminal domain-containing protein [Paenibacillus urinalis]
MKKTVLTIMTGVLAFGMLGFTSGSALASSQQVEVLLNTNKMSFPDAKPFQDAQGSVMVPIRFVSESLGAKVSYSKTGKVQTVGITSKDHTVKMTVGRTTALVNGKKKDYGTKIILKQNRTFVPIRLVSEGLGQKVEWDKISRWVWIGEKDFRSTDDKEFKLTKLSEFKAYTKTKSAFTNLNDKAYSGVKIIKESDLPIQLGNSQVVYSLNIVKNQVTGDDLVQIRSSQRGNPVSFLVKNDYAKGRQVLDAAFINNGDKTAMNHYPVVSRSDKFQTGKYIESYEGWRNFKINQADYILLEDGDLENYAVVIVNPFK